MTSPLFPYEILEMIAFNHPMAFKQLYQTCWQMAQMNVLCMMNKSVKEVKYDDRIEYQLPNGQLHRNNEPAVIYTDGFQLWYQNRYIHRDDGPAIICARPKCIE